MSTILSLILTLGVGAGVAYYCYKLGYEDGIYKTRVDNLKEDCDDMIERIKEIQYILGKNELEQGHSECFEKGDYFDKCFELQKKVDECFEKCEK